MDLCLQIRIRRNFATTSFTCDDAHFQFNSSSQLIFINFSSPLYLGGVPRDLDQPLLTSFDLISPVPNFSGTMRNFVVSSFSASPERPKMLGKGVGVYVRVGDACEKSGKNYCNYNGVCIAVDDYVKTCQCRIGYFGEFCEVG